MLHFSPAQKLHLEILEEVVYFATGLRKHGAACRPGHCRSLPRELMPLLGVCSSWRSVAARIFYMECLISTNAATSPNPYRLFMNSLDSIVNSKAEGFVGCIRARVSNTSIVSGSAAEYLLQPQFAKTVLPRVYFLELDIFRLSNDTSEEEDAAFMQSAVGFCERIKQLLPNLSYIVFSCMGLAAYPSIVNAMAVSLTSIQPRSFEFCGPMRHLRLSELGHLVNLTRFGLFDSNVHEDYVELVRRNASTLEDLTLWHVKHEVCLEVIEDCDGKAIVYPRLRTLDISTADNMPSESSAAPAGTPFPALTYLICTREYPFADDILFRGNNRTLEKLYLSVTPWSASIITKLNVFARNRHPKLCYLTLEAEKSFIMSDGLALSVTRIPFEIGPQLKDIRMQFQGQIPSRIIMDAISYSTAPNSVTLLRIPVFKPDVLCMIGIVKKFPNLNRIWFQIAGEEAGQEENGQQPPLDLSQLPGLHKAHYPISAHLHALQFRYSAGKPPLQMVADILITASLIPSLRFVVSNWRSEHGSKSVIKDLVCDPMFASYADHLRSLKYATGMWRESKILEVF